MSSVTRMMLVSFASCVILVGVISLLLGLFRPYHGYHFAHIALAIIGALFAVIATYEAHRAFTKAEAVEHALGSFRMTFEVAIEEMVARVRKAEHVLILVLPTPAYGYLFGEPALSRQLVEAIEAFLSRDHTRVQFLFVGADMSEARESLPQVYLRRAEEMSRVRTSGISRNEYVQLVTRVLRAIMNAGERAAVRLLPYDPRVRLVIADSTDPDRRASVMVFAQSNPSEMQRDFESKGFASTRVEMVDAIRDLWKVYNAESAAPAELTDVVDQFTTNL